MTGHLRIVDHHDEYRKATGFTVGETVGVDYPFYRGSNEGSIALGRVLAVDEEGRIVDWVHKRWVRDRRKGLLA